MKWMQATLTFNALHYNPARKGKLGVWRVHHCSEVGNPLKTRVDSDMFTGKIGKDGKHESLGQPVLRLMVAQRLQPGTIVSPVKLALEFNRVCALARSFHLRAVHVTDGSDIIYFGRSALG